jgi:hypothetical protein
VNGHDLIYSQHRLGLFNKCVQQIQTIHCLVNINRTYVTFQVEVFDFFIKPNLLILLPFSVSKSFTCGLEFV